VNVSLLWVIICILLVITFLCIIRQGLDLFQNLDLWPISKFGPSSKFDKTGVGLSNFCRVEKLALQIFDANTGLQLFHLAFHSMLFHNPSYIREGQHCRADIFCAIREGQHCRAVIFCAATTFTVLRHTSKLYFVLPQPVLCSVILQSYFLCCQNLHCAPSYISNHRHSRRHLECKIIPTIESDIISSPLTYRAR
jgi:hypothetical protein